MGYGLSLKCKGLTSLIAEHFWNPISYWYSLVWLEPEDLLQRHIEQLVNTLLLALHSVNARLVR